MRLTTSYLLYTISSNTKTIYKFQSWAMIKCEWVKLKDLQRPTGTAECGCTRLTEERPKEDLMSAPIQRSHVHCESHWKLYTLPFFKAQTGVNRPENSFYKMGKSDFNRIQCIAIFFPNASQIQKGKEIKDRLPFPIHKSTLLSALKEGKRTGKLSFYQEAMRHIKEQTPRKGFVSFCFANTLIW